MYRGIEAIEHFMESIGLVWRPGATASAELRASYRIGNTRPLGIDCTLVEFHCDAKRPKIWVPEFSRTSFHQWFEVPYQDFEFTPGGSMLKIKAAARATRPVQRGPQAAGLTPARGRLQLLVHDGGAVQPVRVMRIAAEARDDAHRHIPSEAYKGSARSPVRVSSVIRLRPAATASASTLPSRPARCPGAGNPDAPAACAPRRGAVDWAGCRNRAAPRRPACRPARRPPQQAAPAAGQHLVAPERQRVVRAVRRDKADAGARVHAGVQQLRQFRQQGFGFGGRERGHAQGGKMVGHVAPVDAVVQTMKSR